MIPKGVVRTACCVIFLTSLLASCDDRPAEDDTTQAATREPTSPVASHVVGPFSQFPTRRICNGGRFHCDSWAVLADHQDVGPLATPQGYGPSDLQSAYNLDVSTSVQATIGIAAAYGYANIETDLAAYRSQFGLPACTIASGCLTVLNQEGQTSPLPAAPPANDDWTQETALDMDMASTGCPSCKILVIQADNDTGGGLLTVNNVAATMGATVMSNSWGTVEQQFASDIGSVEGYFNHPGVAYFTSTGDDGYDIGGQGPDYPSTSAYVTAVGGTTLLQDSTSFRGWSETAWSGGGASCSALIAKPSWQKTSPCTFRAAADIAANADPGTPVAVYNTDAGGWTVVGGTSASSPLVAAMYAQTHNGSATAELPYKLALFDVTSGSDGTCGNSLCNAGVGWDGPTGNGTPNGAVLAGAKAPTFTITSPFPGEFVPPGFAIKTTCTSNDGSKIHDVSIAIDGEPLGDPTAAPFDANAPSSFINGKATVTATCTTSTLIQVTQSVTVTQSQACSSNSACSTKGDICYLGACIAGSGVSGGLGTSCTSDGQCESGNCASTGSNAYCAIACETNGASCPSGFTCVSTSSTTSAGDCIPGGGGCNAGGSPTGFGALLFVVAGLLSPRRWRRADPRSRKHRS